MAFIPSTPLPLHRNLRASTQPRRRTPRASLPKPLFDRVLIRRDTETKTSASGLVLTGESEKPNTGTVIATGQGRYSPDGVVEDMYVKEGDRVLWKDEFGAESVPGEDDMIMLRIFSITAKF